jgi:hypothetical protein
MAWLDRRDGAVMGWTEGEVSEVLGEEDLLFQSGSQSYQVRPVWTLNLSPCTATSQALNHKI